MYLVVFYAYGKRLKKVSRLTPEQIEFLLSSICETYVIESFLRIHSRSRLWVKHDFLEKDVQKMGDLCPELMTAFLNVQFV